MTVALRSVYFLVRKSRSLKVQTGREIEKERQGERGRHRGIKRERERDRLTPREAASE